MLQWTWGRTSFFELAFSNEILYKIPICVSFTAKIPNAWYIAGTHKLQISWIQFKTILFRLNLLPSPSQRPKGNYPPIPEASCRNSNEKYCYITHQWSLKDKQILTNILYILNPCFASSLKKKKQKTNNMLEINSYQHTFYWLQVPKFNKFLSHE